MPAGNLTLATVMLGAAFAGVLEAQAPLLREATRGEVWITRPTIAAAPPSSPKRIGLRILVADSTPPTPPGDLVAESSGYFLISGRWSPSVDPESGIDHYAFAIGTGTSSETESNVRGWQSNSLRTKIKINLALTPGITYYLNVKATNGANLSSTVVSSMPLTPSPKTYGQSANQIGYVITPTGYDATGAETSTWAPERLAELSGFLDKMLPVISDLYGPPSTTYNVALVRDLRYTTSAIFLPSTDAIHLGDNATYQLLTHEFVHAWRRAQILSSGSVWQFDPTLSGFEEGFAQAVSYEAMTEFALRYPTFDLSQKLYQSSTEWDYDFQNVPELRTTDFWSDSGGMLLYWIRYEMAAAATAKIAREHPGFYRAFNAEYYRRLNLDPHLTSSRGLIKQIIEAVAPTIEDKPAARWIDEQYVFDCAHHPGRKIWLLTQHYPSTEYFVFNRTFFYETFSNGSDWAFPDGAGGFVYYHLNGSRGTVTVRANSGDVVWRNDLAITPLDNPPVYNGYGNDEANLTTQPTIFPWPGGDPTKYLTNISTLGLYRMTTQFSAGATVTRDDYRVVGAPLRNTAGVFGGVIGANGGSIYLRHRNHGPGLSVPVVNGAFWTATPWASLKHPATDSVDTEPGIIDIIYVDGTGKRLKDVRTIGYGSSSGTQLFLFDVARMVPVSEPRRRRAVAAPPR
jgi:hypothetical protein